MGEVIGGPVAHGDVERAAAVRVHGVRAGVLLEREGGRFSFVYDAGYGGPPVSLTMPVREAPYDYDRFPPFFDGLLPEGWQLEALLRQAKLDKGDLMGQLLAVGPDTVGAVTVEPLVGEPSGKPSGGPFDGPSGGPFGTVSGDA